MKTYVQPKMKPHKLKLGKMVMASQDAPVTPNSLEDFTEVEESSVF